MGAAEFRRRADQPRGLDCLTPRSVAEIVYCPLGVGLSVYTASQRSSSRLANLAQEKIVAAKSGILTDREEKSGDRTEAPVLGGGNDDPNKPEGRQPGLELALHTTGAWYSSSNVSQ